MSSGRLVVEGVSIGKARPTSVGSVGVTGIYKEPVSEPVFFGVDGVAGDAVCDSSCHGGPDQAVYVYMSEDYKWWEDELGYLPSSGTFGENLTVRGMSCRDVAIGDRLIFDGVTLEVTCPRIPCSTFAEKMQDPTFVKRFRNAARPGFYCRVLREGKMAADESGLLEIKESAPRVGLLELFEDYYDKSSEEARIRRYLAAPVASRQRVKLEARLSDIVSMSSGE